VHTATTFAVHARPADPEETSLNKLCVVSSEPDGHCAVTSADHDPDVYSPSLTAFETPLVFTLSRLTIAPAGTGQPISDREPLRCADLMIIDPDTRKKLTTAVAVSDASDKITLASSAVSRKRITPSGSMPKLRNAASTLLIVPFDAITSGAIERNLLSNAVLTARSGAAGATSLISSPTTY